MERKRNRKEYLAISFPWLMIYSEQKKYKMVKKRVNFPHITIKIQRFLPELN